MKKYLIGAIAIITSNSAFAETWYTSPYVTLEREFKGTEYQTLTAGIDAELPLGIATNFEINTTDKDDFNFRKDNFEWDFTYDVNKNVGFYLENDLDNNFDTTSTVGGVTYRFW